MGIWPSGTVTTEVSFSLWLFSWSNVNDNGVRVDDEGVDIAGGGVTKSTTGITVLGTTSVVFTVVVQSALAPYKKGSTNKRLFLIAMFGKIGSLMELH